MFQSGGMNYTTVPSGEAQNTYYYCETDEFDQTRTVSVTAFSQSDADTCSQAQCTNCSFTAGMCP
jgi:hypothetical protein